MSYQQHIIKRQIVELEMTSGLDSTDIQARVSRICREQLAGLLGEHLGRGAATSKSRIDRLELNLGIIPVGSLEQLFAERVASELQQSFPEVSGDASITTCSEDTGTDDAPGSDLDLIGYFLETGLMPWWATAVSYRLLGQVITSAIKQNASSLRRLLTGLLHKPLVPERLIYTCDDQMLDLLIGLYLPGRLGEIKELEVGLRRSMKAGGTEPFRTAWWYGLFKMGMDEQVASGHYDPQTVARMLISLVEAKNSSAGTPSTFIAEPHHTALVAKIFNCKAQKVHAGAGIPDELRRTAQPDYISGSVNAIDQSLTSIRNQLQAALREWSGPAVADANSKRQSILAEIGHLRALIENAEATNTGANKIVRDLLEMSRQWESVHPVSTESRQPASADAGRQLALISKAIDLIQKYLRDSGQPAAKAAEKRPSSLRTRQAERLYNPFSESDKISIQNSGLVLLWPFLPRFFANIGLAGDEGFMDEDARIRACLLLQYLVEGTSGEFFEAMLPLNKVLCGIDLLQPVHTQWTISPDEAAAAEHLLEAVIQNGPLWKTLSVEGFQRAYLQREGLLSTRDGAWLLQVARETYDIIIDRLPWTIQHVKLPWMDRMIFTEWQKA